MALIPIFFSYNQKNIENMLNFENCATIIVLEIKKAYFVTS